MNDQMQKEILARVDALAAKLGVAVHRLMELYYREAIIDGMEYTVAAMALVALAVFLGVWLRRTLKRGIQAEDEMLWGLNVLFKSVGAIVALIWAGNVAAMAIDCLANPTLYAFEHIVSAVK